jgi:hypothetical protein
MGYFFQVLTGEPRFQSETCSPRVDGLDKQYQTSLPGEVEVAALRSATHSGWDAKYLVGLIGCTYVWLDHLSFHLGAARSHGTRRPRVFANPFAGIVVSGSEV